MPENRHILILGAKKELDDCLTEGIFTAGEVHKEFGDTMPDQTKEDAMANFETSIADAKANICDAVATLKNAFGS